MVRASQPASAPLRGTSGVERGQPLSIRVAGATDVGPERPANEDQFFIANVRRSLVVRASSLSPPLSANDKHQDTTDTLLIIADGIGGYAGGALASSTATRHLAGDLLWSLGVPCKSTSRADEVRDRLMAAIVRAHHAVRRLASRPDVHHNLGTTVTLAYIEWPSLHVAHVGDSRCYLLRDGRLQRLTTDHTIAEQLRQSDALPPGARPAERYEHVLTNSVGGHSEPEPQVETTKLQRGDTILLCTDGLTGPIGDRLLAAALQQGHPPEETCTQLLQLARERGARDNATVVMAQIL